MAATCGYDLVLRSSLIIVIAIVKHLQSVYQLMLVENL